MKFWFWGNAHSQYIGLRVSVCDHVHYDGLQTIIVSDNIQSGSPPH